MFGEHYFIFFLSCFIFVEPKPLVSVSEDFNIIMSCNSTYSVDKKTLNKALIEKQFQDNVDENFKCFLHCLYRKYEWMDSDGVFQYVEMRSTLFETDLNDYMIEYLLKTCTELDTKNKCEKAFLFTKCFWTESKKLEKTELSELDDFY